MELKRKALSEEHKRKISIGIKKNLPSSIFKKGHNAWHAGKKLSQEHKNKLSKSHLGLVSGKESPNWRGGQNLSYWKKEVKKRDKKCKRCGNMDKRVLTADHIKSKKMYPNLQFKISNGITLCYNCHAIKTLEDKGYREWMSKNHWYRNGRKK